MHVLLDLLSLALLIGGIYLGISGAFGVLRFPDFYSRLHAVSVCDTLGAGMVLLGLMLQGGLTLVTVKLMLIFYFMVFSGPTAVHALAEAAQVSGLDPVEDDPEDG